ncbi:PAS domain S-box protein [Hymenobacter guriensis]|uniref:histidine kinase n=1 Tax=Hymenobacter guriensis TaxID=2793065 RepID=A0ABS0KZD0_9BACT|nr:PAS domain S-box protein [Hymenobacter guriensis]MBG8552718.1 PAS domain S-box protein [Hymenobacter guriensis]
MLADFSFQNSELFPSGPLLSAVLDLAANGLVLCTPIRNAGGILIDLTLTYLNPAAQRLLKLPAQPTATFTQQFSASLTDGTWALLRDAFSASTPGSFHLPQAVTSHQTCLHLAGERVGGGLLLSFTEVPDAATQPASLQADGIQQLARFDAVLGSLQEFVYVFDLESRFRYVNQPLLDLWGLTLQQAVGKSFSDLEYPAPLATLLQAQIQQVITTRQAVTGETPYTSSTGQTGEYEYIFVPLFGADGAVEAVGGRAQPVTERRQAEAALRASETRYHTLFNSIDEGFCLIEVLFNQQQQAIDYRFEEVNRAFELQTGLVNATGRTVGEMAPQLEQHWFDIYGAVALTGQPVRFEQRAEPLHRWYDVYAFRVGEPGQHRVAVLFNDISQRRQAEEALRKSERQQAFLLQFSDQLRHLVNPADIQYQAVCALGQYLGASRVGYAEDQGDDAHIVVTRNYTRSGVSGIEGRYPYDDYGPELLRALKEGKTVVRPDVAHDPSLTEAEKAAHAALHLGATVNVPLLKDGRLVAVLFMHELEAHAWTEDELALLEETAERTWAAVLHARTAAALRESEERFRVMADAVPQIVWITDAEGHTEFFNRQWSRYTGVAYEPSTAAIVTGEFVHSEDAAHTMEAFEEARRSGTPFQVEHRIRAADGTYRWFLVRAEPFLDPTSGQITRWFGSSVDIHDRKQAEVALRRSEKRLQRVLSIATVGVLFFDLEGGIHDSNPAFERMSGYSRAELANGHAYLDALTAPEFILPTHRALQELRTAGESTPFEKQYLRPDGSRWWGLSAGKRLDETECVKFVLDITEAKQAEEALRLSQQQLQHSNEQLTRTNVDLDNFIYTASHDLKSPITNIEGLLYALQAQLPAEVQHTYDVVPLLRMMQESVARFQRTIGHLSDITRLQQEYEPLVSEVLLQPVIEDVCHDLQPLIEATGARIELDVAACPRVAFSLKNLRSVVYNLLSNAVKYRHPDRPPHVRIYCQPDPEGKALVLSVQDNGLGIKESRYPELFAMFRRLHNHVEGSGIGLYMVKRIVENVGGRIEVQSQLDVGSTFSVHLPYAPEPAV